METAEPRLFRATREAWLGQFLLPLVFFLLLTFTAVKATGLDPWAGAAGVGLVLVIALLKDALPMLRNWLQLDARSIEGSLNGRYFQIYWAEVLAAWVVVHMRQRFLCLGTRAGTLVLPLRFFDDCTLWKWVSLWVPPAALEPDAARRLPEYQKIQAEREQAASLDGPADASPQRTVTDHWLLQVIGWTGLVFFIFGAYDSGLMGRLPQLCLFVGLAGISAWILLTWGITELGAETVERYTLFGGWAIDWKDVRQVEVDPSDSVIVLIGEDCRMVIPGPGRWGGGASKQAAMTDLLAQIEKRRIPLRRTSAALFKDSRNTRLKK